MSFTSATNEMASKLLMQLVSRGKDRNYFGTNYTGQLRLVTMLEFSETDGRNKRQGAS